MKKIQNIIAKTNHSFIYEMALCILFLFSFSINLNAQNPTPTGDTTQSFCKTDNATIANLNATGTQIEWFDSETNGNKLSESKLLENGKTYYADDVANSASSISRLAVKAIIEEVLPPKTPLGISFCLSNQPTIASLSITGDNIEWYSEKTGGVLLASNTLLISDTSYWAQQTINNCTSTRVETYVEIKNASAPIVASEQFFCSITPSTIGDLKATGKNIYWYATETSQIQLLSSTVLEDGKEYWASQKPGQCESTERASTIAHISSPSPAITANSTQTFCVNDHATVADLTATGTNIKWYADETDTTPLDFTEVLIDNEDYWATQTIDDSCESVTKFKVTASIVPVQAPTTTNSTQDFCITDNATIANLTTNETNIKWYATESDTTPLNPTDALINNEDYWATQTNAENCESTTRLKVTVSILSVNPPTTANSTQNFCVNDNATVANLSPNGTNIKWYASENDTTPLNLMDALINNEDYWATQTNTENCESDNRLKVTVEIIPVQPPTITNSTQTFCEIDNATVGSLTATGTTIKWYATETDTTPLNSTDVLVDGTDYWATQTNTESCESITRTKVTVAITSVTPPTANSAQEFCEIDDAKVADLTASGTNIKWYANENDTTPLSSSTALTNNEDYFATQTNAEGCESISKTKVTVSIVSVPAPTTTNSTQTFCVKDNPTVADLLASGTDLKWYTSKTSNTPLNLTDALIPNKYYYATQTNANNCESETRLRVRAIILSVNAPTTTNNTQTFCVNDNATVANLSANGTNIKWYANENDTTPLDATAALVDGNDYWASQTNTLNCESISKTKVTVAILSVQAPTVTNSTQTFCEIDNATVANLTATGTTIKWYATETDTTPLNSIDALVDGIDYWATQTNTESCESITRTKVTVAITAVTPPTANNAQEFCEINNATVANLTASGTNIKWYANENDTTPLSSSTALTNNEDYFATQTNTEGCESISKTKVTVSIVSVPAPTTTDSTPVFCEKDYATIASLVVNGTNIKWYASVNDNTPLNATELLVDGTDYYATQTTTDGCESVNRLKVTVSILSANSPTTTNSTQTFCVNDNATVANLSANGTNIKWYANENDTTPLDATAALVDGNDYWASQTNTLNCESISKTKVTVAILSVQAPTVTNSTQTFCEIDNATVASLTATGTTIKWYATETDTTPLNSTDALVDGTDYWATQTNTESCESITRTKVTVAITAVTPPTANNTQEFCEINNATVANLTATGTNIKWYANENDVSPLSSSTALTNNEDYFATQTNTEGCESISKTKVTVSIVSVPAPTTTDSTPVFCEKDYATIASLVVTGTNIKWYANENDATPLSSSIALINNEDYYATQTTTDGCESVNRLKVTVSILSANSPATTNSTQTFCVNDNATVANLSANGTNIAWYANENDITPLNATEVLADGNDYWASQTNSENCESTSKTKVTVVIISTLAPTVINSTQTFCESEYPTIANLVATGTTIKWYASESSSTPLNSTDALVDGTDYWATQTNTESCESITRTKVTVAITAVTPPTANSTQEFCEINNATVANLTATGTNIKWYANENDATPLSSSTALINNEDYFATQTNAEGCESISKTKVTVSIVSVPAPTTTDSTPVFCEKDNATIASLVVNGTNIKWYASVNDNTPLNATDLLVDGTDYYATQTTTDGCESVNRLKVTVSILSANSPATTNSTQTFCVNDNATVANLSATGTNIKWYANENDTTPLDTTEALVDGNNYWASQTNTLNCESISKTKVTVIIISTQAPTVTNSTQTFCEIDNATVASLTATGTTIKWYATENDATPLNSTDALVDGTDYWATQTNTANCESVSRLKVTVAITSVTPPTVDNTPVFCEYDSPTIANLSASGTNIKWYANENDTTPLSSSTALINNEDYFATQTNDEGCESATKSKVIVSILPVELPIISNTTQVFCESETPTIADLVATGTTIKWYASENDTTPLNLTDALINNEDYWATQTNANNCESTSKIKITVSILSVQPPTTDNNAPSFCIYSNPTIGDLVVTGTTIKWYATATDKTPLSLTDLLSNNEDYYATQTSADNCESTSRLKITVNLSTTLPSIITQETIVFCEIENASVKDLNTTNANTIWYESEFSTTPLNSTTKLIDGEDYWSQEITTINKCEQATKIQKIVKITKVDAPTTTNAAPVFCINDYATLANLQITGTNIKWYASETATTPLNLTTVLADNEDYYATQTNADNCESATRLKIVVTIQQINTPTTATTTFSFCKTEKATLAEIILNESNIQWYASENSTTSLPTSVKLIDGNSYWASTIDQITTCESINRIEIKVTITDTEKATTLKTTQTFCNTSNATIENLSVEGTNINWYATENSKAPLPNTHLLEHNTTYWATQTNSTTGCESSERLNVLVILQDPTYIELNDCGNQFCKDDLPTISDLHKNISSNNLDEIIWYDSFPNGTALDASDLLVHGATYYAYDPTDTCNLDYALEVKVNLTFCDPSGVKYYSGFSPNGDGINDVFTITNLRMKYPNFEVEFYNRWGKRLYISNASNQDWNGKNNGTGELAPEGVYYFIINFNSGNIKPIQNTLYLSR